MPRPRTAMRKIREVLRLGLGQGLSPRQVAASLSLPRITVRRYLERAHLADVSWPLPAELDDMQLERLLYPPTPPSGSARPQPDWSVVHHELRRKDVTLQLLWLEYRAGAPQGYEYSQFCRRYREWQRLLDVVMRQEHRAGEKLFVDWPGRTVPIVNPINGEVTLAEIFIGVLGASNYTYAEAFPSQELPHWISGHIHAFEFFGCVPRIVVCDNLRAGVTKSHRYEPLVNATYQEMAALYGVAIIPARVHKPRDKAKVEAGVLIVERWILALMAWSDPGAPPAGPGRICRASTSLSMATAAVAAGDSATLGGHPGLRRSRPKGGITVCETKYSFWIFSTALSLSRPFLSTGRIGARKRRKPALRRVF
jgi:transposase